MQASLVSEVVAVLAFSQYISHGYSYDGCDETRLPEIVAVTDSSIPDFCAAADGFLASTNSILTLLQVDDLAEEAEQVNVPATFEENPNWRRRVSLSLEDLATDPRLNRVAIAMQGDVATK
jgi:4-alpha-glucanotransferase